MSEQVLQAIVKLFAILVKERNTEEERYNIKQFLLLHLNREATSKYMALFDSFCAQQVTADGVDSDDDTKAFLGEWALIHQVAEQINQGLVRQQKIVLIEKIIELFFLDQRLSERQSNLIYHLGDLIKIEQREIQELSAFIRARKTDELACENSLVIGPKVSGNCARFMKNKELEGDLIFLRAAKEVYFMKYLGHEDLLFNGLNIQAGSIYIFPNGSSIKGEAISPIYYSDVVNQFVQTETATRITFVAENIQYKFRGSDNGLKGVSIAEEGGKLIGIMGSSGSGKSTLLSILNGSERPQKGRILINGQDLHAGNSEMLSLIGYVPQDDFLIEELTVFENLHYAARLSFRDKSDEDLNELVKKVLKNLGLVEIKNLKVGSPMNKTISGGQRKRLNIGLELLREPTILFADEPTSGLSSRDSENIMDLLKEISLRGKMVFVVIHQPASDIFKMFDSLLILDVGGYPIYYGNPIEAVIHFKETVDMINSEHGECPECGNINSEQIFNIVEMKVVNEFGRLTEERKVSPKQWHEIFVNKTKKKRIKPSKDDLNLADRAPKRLNQFRIYLSRDLKSKISSKQYVWVNLLQAPLLAFFLSLLVKFSNGEEDYTYLNNSNIPTFLFMSVIVAIFLGLTISSKEIIKDQKIRKREHFLRLSRTSYILSKMVILFGISAIQTAFFVAVSCYLLDINGQWFSFWIILFSVSCASNMAGLNLSSAFKTTITVYILIPILLIPQLIMSGVVVQFDRFNSRFANHEKVPLVGDAMLSRWAFEALCVDFFVNNEFEENFYELDKIEANARYFNLFFMDQMAGRITSLMDAIKEDSLNSDDARKNLRIVQNEMRALLDEFGYDKYPEFEQLQRGRFDISTLVSGLIFLTTAQQVYNNRRDVALEKKDSVVQGLMKAGKYETLRRDYHNEELSTIVRHSHLIQKIVEGDTRLVRKYEPIYGQPQPNHFLDYRAPFFTPSKHFLGRIFTTPRFNIMVIWMMVGFLYVTLYFEVPRALLKAFDISRYLSRQKDK